MVYGLVTNPSGDFKVGGRGPGGPLLILTPELLACEEAGGTRETEAARGTQGAQTAAAHQPAWRYFII